ncbi:MAG: hypothetical protein ACXVJD_10475 [Mucilaginibacter sp.]
MKLQISLYFCYCLLTACVVLHRNNIPKQQADDYKKSILAISNDLFQKGVHVHGGYTIPYRLLSPERLGFSRRYPLVLVLHSSGTPQGTDNKSQLGVLAKLWAQPAIRENYLAYVLAPQFPVRSSNYGPIQTNDILTSAADHDWRPYYTWSIHSNTYCPSTRARSM